MDQNLGALRSAIEHELLERIIPFWQGLKDDQHGGYIGQVDQDLTLQPGADKAVLLHSRILWFFASAARQLARPDLLEYARQAYQFLVDYCFDAVAGGVVWSVTAQGEPVDTTKQAYNQAFAIYALAAWHRASGEQKALDLAFELFNLLEQRFRVGNGYQEAFDANFNLIENDKLSENGVIAERTMNTLLHVFEAYAELYLASGRQAKVGQVLRQITDMFVDRIYSPTNHRLEVFFDAELNPLIDLQSYGHDIEAAWLLDWGIEALEDPALTERLQKVTADLTDSVYQRAWAGGAVLYEALNGQVDTTRVWWVQAEAMISFYAAAQRPGTSLEQAEAYLLACSQLWDYIETHIIDRRPGGEWFYQVDPTGQPTPDKPIVSTWKCPYHSGRACLKMLADLDPPAGIGKDG